MRSGGSTYKPVWSTWQGHCNAFRCASLVTRLRLFKRIFTSISRKIVRPRVGRILQRAIGRARIEAAVHEYEAKGNQDCDKLRDLLALLELVEADPQLSSEQAIAQLDRIAAATGRDPAEVIQELEAASTAGQIAQFAESLVPHARLLPIHEDVLYGNDPMVHRTVCRVLEELRDKLVPYDIDCWNRLRSTVAAVVSFTYFTRDILPTYCLCKEDKGKGQSASRRPSRRRLSFARAHFGTQSVYEAEPVAGGRTDSGLRFSEVEFPDREFKHEFQRVNREHIRGCYLTTSDYASARGRVTFLLILDLRADNVAGHKDRVKVQECEEIRSCLFFVHPK